jgi:hypothetical protein
VSSSAVDIPLQCALYDFQYVGLGLPTHDLVYFLGTSVESKLLKSVEDEKKLLQDYFSKFQLAISPDHDAQYTFEKFWSHWELSIVDWYRFMVGWGFWGNDGWVEHRVKQIVLSWTESGLSL